MKIAVIGSGAIGSVVAGYLTKYGEDITLIGKPDQVAVIREKGLHILREGVRERINVKVANRLEKNFDLVIFTVKTQDLEDAYQANHQFLEDCLVLTTQNGVQADNLLSTHFEREKMLSSIVMFGATYLLPGEVTFNFSGDWIIGKPYTTNDDSVPKVAEILKKAFPVFVSYDIMGMKWLKLFVNFNNCIPALIGKSMQETYSDIDFCRLSVALLKEGLQIIKMANISLVSLPQFPVERIFGLATMPTEQAVAIVNKTLTNLSQEPLYGSILQSVMRKRSSEIDFINGEINQVALSLRITAPLNELVVKMVHEVENTGKYYSADEVKSVFGLA